MSGCYDSVIGVKKELSIQKFLTKRPLRYEPAEGQGGYGCVIIEMDYFKDERGFFLESWNRRDFAEAGLSEDFVQDSHSSSRYGVLRGLHYQDMQAPQAKLVRCSRPYLPQCLRV